MIQSAIREQQGSRPTPTEAVAGYLRHMEAKRKAERTQIGPQSMRSNAPSKRTRDYAGEPDSDPWDFYCYKLVCGAVDSLGGGHAARVCLGVAIYHAREHTIEGYPFTGVAARSTAPSTERMNDKTALRVELGVLVSATLKMFQQNITRQIDKMPDFE